MNKELSNDKRLLNILVLGNSGVGKSTLIKAVSGVEVQVGVGEGNTQNIGTYESTTWPFRFIDTKGFEYSKSEQSKTLKQVKKFTKEQINLSQTEEGKYAGIDVVWYCIDGTARRAFTYNVEMVAKTIRAWKDVPVFVVITKSYSEADVNENVEAINAAFAKSKRSVNLQKIIPVVAEPYKVDDEFVIPPKGVDELCTRTVGCSDMAIKISDENKKRMIMEQKRFTANALVTGATTAGVVVGAAPISFADSLILVPIETGLTKGILKIYGIDFGGDIVSAIVGSAAISTAAKTAVSALKTIPNIAGSVVNAVVAGFVIAALGETVVAVSEAIYLGKIDKNKVENVAAFVAEKMNANPVLGSVVKYFTKNSAQLENKSAKEIFTTISDSINKSN